MNYKNFQDQRPIYSNNRDGNRTNSKWVRNGDASNYSSCNSHGNSNYHNNKSKSRKEDSANDNQNILGKCPSREKFRRMSCLVHLYSGACPYGDKCCYLHDIRLGIEGIDVIQMRAQSRATRSEKDTFYFPDMDPDDIMRHTDSSGIPMARQNYDIPSSFKSVTASIHDRAIYSSWVHLTEFCNDQRQQVSNHRKHSHQYRDGFDTVLSSYLPTTINPIQGSSIGHDIVGKSSMRNTLQYNPSREHDEANNNREIMVEALNTNQPKSSLSINSNGNQPFNRYIPHLRRLPIFIQLGNGIGREADK